MKYKAFTVFFVIVSLLLSGCSLFQSEPKQETGIGQDIFSDELMRRNDTVDKDFRRAVWVSYLDIVPMMSTDKSIFEKNVDNMLDNLATISTTDVFFQVRAFGDSLYPSEIYPSASETLYNMSDGFDYFDIVLAKCHERGIKLHAWVNPFRLHGSKDGVYQAFIDALDEKDYDAVTSVDGSRTLNPASETAQELVINGVKEILDNYDVDGIHLDDYFYPTTETEFDEHYYSEYLAGGGSLSLIEWRRGNVTDVVKGIYDAVKAKSADIEFGIAPDASIERNMEKHCLDVEFLCKNAGYIDYICPQVYFGYENSNMPFLTTVSTWSDYSTACELMFGLSFYKVGADDPYAGSGNGEWLYNNDIISRQYLDSLEITNCVGVAFYRYDSIFNPDSEAVTHAANEYENLKKAI